MPRLVQWLLLWTLMAEPILCFGPSTPHLLSPIRAHQSVSCSANALSSCPYLSSSTQRSRIVNGKRRDIRTRSSIAMSGTNDTPEGKDLAAPQMTAAQAVRGIYDAYNRRDLEGYLDFLDDKVEYNNFNFEEPFRGKGAVRELITRSVIPTPKPKNQTWRPPTRISGKRFARSITGTGCSSLTSEP
mmetsp:Transcript_29369/g.46092  ORF Transcript_29369/g.46092 Transcript_29369/m.46092 type:complete len:186 (+) Transcript_29369:180-737(+)